MATAMNRLPRSRRSRDEPAVSEVIERLLDSTRQPPD
jgi:hypothetical protein